MVRMSHTREMKKANHLCLWMAFCAFGFSLMAGCATTSKSLGPETRGKIKKLGIAVVLKDKELRVFDHTEVSKKTYGGYMLGAIGGALEGIAIAVETNIRIRSSLGGDPDLLRKQLGEYRLNEVVAEDLTYKLSEKYEIVNADEFVNELRETRKGEKLEIDDYLDVCRKCEADTMLKVDFSYGLAAYAREKASAAVIANFSVYDVETKTLLMKKEIVSDNYFKKSRIITDFAANDSELYKRDVLEAVNVLSVIVARDLGLDVTVPQVTKPFAAFPDEISAIKMSCNNPYKIGQDCSALSGAKRTIRIKEREMKVAGSDDGKIILVMHKRYTGDESIFACFELVRDELVARGITILKVFKLVSVGRLRGFVLELDGDGYSILRDYSVE